jgi:hypothetical protein
MSDVNNTTDQTTDDGDTIADHSESHYSKATHDNFDYIAIVKLGDQWHSVLTSLLVEHDDGFVTLEPPIVEHENFWPGLAIGGRRVPCPRGLSVRKECVLAVIDAPMGS